MSVSPDLVANWKLCASLHGILVNYWTTGEWEPLLIQVWTFDWGSLKMAEEYRLPTLGSLQGDSISDSLVAEEYWLPTLGRSGDHESAEWCSRGLRLHFLFVQLHVT